MIKKLIVIAMLVAMFGIGNVTYAQATSGSPGKQSNVGRKGRSHTRRYRRHRRGGRRGYSRSRRSPKNLNPQPLPPE
jgi:hypothetical protein